MIASRPLPGSLAALLAAGALTLVSGRALAGACTTDADCGKGLACQVVGSSVCTNMACPAGADCPQSPPCTPTDIKACVPGPCSVDSDCGDGMVCYENPNKACASPPTAACPPGVKCDAAPPPTPDCTVTTAKVCVPRYLLPCTTASDCGTGFNCVLDTSSCGCAGSGMATPGTEPAPAPSGSSIPPSMAAADAGAAPMPDCPPCPPATTSRCEPQVVDCSATSDCPSGWLCTEMGSSSGGVACGAPVYPDGGVGMTVCDPAPPPTVVKQCTPPYYDVIGHASDIGGFNEGSGTVGLPQAGSQSGAAGATNSGSPPSAPTSATAPGTGAASSGDQGGCQIGHGGSNAGVSLLALFGLAGLARRKRTTRREG